MSYDINQLQDIVSEAQNLISAEIFNAYRNNELNEVLSKHGYSHLIDDAYEFYDKRNSKIIIIGDCESIGIDQVRMTLKKSGVDSNDYEIISDYSKITNMSFDFLKNSSIYSDVLIGPMPHKVKGIEGYSSLPAMIMDNQKNYPKLTEIVANSSLKISKASLRDAINKTRYINDRKYGL